MWEKVLCGIGFTLDVVGGSCARRNLTHVLGLLSHLLPEGRVVEEPTYLELGSAVYYTQGTFEHVLICLLAIAKSFSISFKAVQDPIRKGYDCYLHYTL